MKRILLGLLAGLLSLGVWAQDDTSPEALYEAYTTPETRAVLERFEQLERETAAAEAARTADKTLALALSLVIALIPLGYIGLQVVKRQSYKTNPGGTAKALGVGLLGGAVLFGLNYGVFLLKLRMGGALNTVLAYLLVLAIVVGAIWLLKKKNPTNPNNQAS